MKTIVFIFIPVVIERTEIRVVAAPPPQEQSNDESCPFWTWFIDNPRPKSAK